MNTPDNGGRDFAQVVKSFSSSLGEDVKRPFSYKIFGIGVAIFIVASVVRTFAEVLGILIGFAGFALIAWSVISFWGWLQENSLLSIFAQKDFESTNSKQVESRDKEAYKVMLQSWDAAMDMIGASKKEVHEDGFLARSVKSYWQGPKYNGKNETVYYPKPEKAYSDRFGLNFELRTPLGWTLDRFEKVMPQWAELVGVPMRADSVRPGYIRITALTAGDLLDGIRYADTSEKGLKVLIARAETGEDIYLDFQEDTHTAIQGSTRSGKSVLMYVALSQLAKCEKAEIWGSDINAALLSPIASALPDEEASRRFVLENNPRANYELLERVVAILDDRMTLLREQEIEKFRDFSQDFPAVVVVIEEYPGLIRTLRMHDSQQTKTADKIEKRYLSLLGRLVGEGAKVGIRLVLLAQRISAEVIDTDSRENFMQKITLGVNKTESVGMLNDELTPEEKHRVTTFSNGRFVIAQKRKTFFCQADYLEYEDYKRAVRFI